MGVRPTDTEGVDSYQLGAVFGPGKWLCGYFQLASLEWN